MVSLYFLQDYDFYKKGKIFKVPYQRAKDESNRTKENK